MLSCVSHTFATQFARPGKKLEMRNYFSNPRLQQVSALVAAGTLESGL